MAIHFQVRDGLVEVTFPGTITSEDMHQLMVKYMNAESRLEIKPDRIVDLSNIEGGVDLPASEVKAFANKRNATHFKNKMQEPSCHYSCSSLELLAFFSC